MGVHFSPTTCEMDYNSLWLWLIRRRSKIWKRHGEERGPLPPFPRKKRETLHCLSGCPLFFFHRRGGTKVSKHFFPHSLSQLLKSLVISSSSSSTPQADRLVRRACLKFPLISFFKYNLGTFFPESPPKKGIPKTDHRPKKTWRQV